MSVCEFQILSDLHLETPQIRPSYDDFKVQPQCPYLVLLGDIGNIADSRLFDFLNRQLQQFRIVFYVMGNHEPYGMTIPEAHASLRAFEAEVERRHRSSSSIEEGGRFVFLDRTRFDCSENLTVLGCTLFSDIKPEQQDSVSRFVSDFSSINEWTVEAHCAAHRKDLNWLIAQVASCAKREPHRSIVILTHYSPTMLKVANDPWHIEDRSQVRSAFVTDLSDRICWTSPQVKLWGFGHTHHNCDFEDLKTKKRVVTNQKGYRRSELITFDGSKVVTVVVGSPSESELPKEVERNGERRFERSRCTVLWFHVTFPTWRFEDYCQTRA